eukprot:11173904-Alexandrium_andersonii.AAC.1
MHMMQELLEYQAKELGNPSSFWNYKDEDYMGWVSSFATSRGGPVGPATTALQVLQRYIIYLDTFHDDC